MEITVNTLPRELPLPPQLKTRSPPQYFSLPTTMAAVGPRGRGKTYNLCLWNKWMFENEYFTRFYVISPTYESNDPVKQIPTRPGDIYTSVEQSIEALMQVIQHVEADAAWYQEITGKYTEIYTIYKKYRGNVAKMEKVDVAYMRTMQRQLESFYENYKILHEGMNLPCKSIAYTLCHKPTPPNKALISILGSRYDDTHPWFYPPPKLRKPVPLLFIDDCSHSPIYSPSRSNPLVNLTLRHRHIGGQGYGVSIQFAVQTFKTGVPKALRQNTMQFLIFKTNDIGTILDIYEEVGAFVDKNSFIGLYNQAIQETHDFLCIDMNAKSERRIFRRGWDTFLVPVKQKDLNEVDLLANSTDETKEIQPSNKDETI
jgi:hypothetical protein